MFYSQILEKTMFRKLFPALVVVLFSYALTGCGDDDPVDPPSPDNPSMRATIDGGSEKEAEGITATRQDSPLASIIAISGIFSDKTSILITLNNVTEAGTIELPGTSTAVYSDPTESIVYTATKGQIEIESIDDEGITGTFTFTGTDQVNNETVEVTNGSFSAKIQ